jgi:hypothetical protein
MLRLLLVWLAGRLGTARSAVSRSAFLPTDSTLEATAAAVMIMMMTKRPPPPAKSL